MGTSAFGGGGQIVALCNYSPLSFNLVLFLLFELEHSDGTVTESPACALRAREARAGAGYSGQAAWPTELGCRAEWLASPSPDFS